MRATFIAVCGAVLIVNCGCSSPVSPIRTTTATAAGYHFTFEYPEGTQHKLEGGRQDDGKGSVTEDVTATCGTQVLHIRNSLLALNGADRGAVKPGDTIKFTSTGKVWVNEQARGE